MVIVCPECSTKFRVNPERIPETGAKVRCARCKHVFLAEKPAPEEQPAPVIAEPEATPVEQEEEPTAVSDELPAEEDAETPDAPPEASPEPSEPEESGFSYDQFRELDTVKTEDEDFTFGGAEEPATESFEAPSPELDKDASTEETDEESFSFSGPEDESPAEETESAEADEEAPLSGEEKIASIFEKEEPETEPELPEVAPQKSNPATSVIRILLLLVLGLVIIGGALYFINGPEQIEQVIEQILGQHTQPGESGQIALNNLEGKFINNQEAGELFVIRGEATNNFREARGAIQVKGVIFDQNGKPLLQKTIFCGNPINDQELQTLPFSELEEMMRNQFGKSLDNMKVNSKEAIPFVIAFRDLPKSLSEFSVDVTSSEPASK